MTDLLLPFITSEFWLQILRFFFGSSVILGTVALIVRLGIVRQLRLQSLLWKAAVAASLLLLLPLANPVFPALTLEPPAAQRLVGGSAEIGSTEVAVEWAANSPIYPAVSPDADAAGHTWRPDPTWLVLLLWAGISGSALFRLWYDHRRALQRIGPREDVDPFSELRKSFVTQCRGSGTHPVPRLTVSERIASPVTLTQREVCLPQWMLESMSTRELSCVLAHEISHIRHRDLLLAGVMQVVVCVFFFQPLLRMARARLLDLAEFIADQEAVASQTDVEQVASVLVDCAERVNRETDVGWGFAMVGDTSRLRCRIEKILRSGPQSAGPLHTPVKILLTLGLLASVLLFPNLDSSDVAHALDTTGGSKRTFAPVACTVAGYESIVDQVHAVIVSPPDGLARWEQSCGSELGNEIDQSWQAFELPGHHLWSMAQAGAGQTKGLSPGMALLYRAWVAHQGVTDPNQSTDTNR